MPRRPFTEEQIGFALRQVEAGTPVPELRRKLGIAEATFYRWKKQFAGLGIAEIRRLKQLEDENRLRGGEPGSAVSTSTSRPGGSAIGAPAWATRL